MQGSTSSGALALMTSGGPAELLERAALLDAVGEQRVDVVAPAHRAGGAGRPPPTRPPSRASARPTRSRPRPPRCWRPRRSRRSPARGQDAALAEQQDAVQDQLAQRAADAGQPARTSAARPRRTPQQQAAAAAAAAQPPRRAARPRRRVRRRARRRPARPARPPVRRPPARRPGRPRVRPRVRRPGRPRVRPRRPVRRAPAARPSPRRCRTRPPARPRARRSQTAIAAAKTQLGLPYSWGGGGSTGPSYGIPPDTAIWGFDCSGLTQYAYAQAGVQIGGTSRDQWYRFRNKHGRQGRPAGR